MTLSIPRLDDDVDPLDAALAYAAAGWYVGPLRRASKHPGSVLGTGWHTRTSRDADVIAAWFTGTDHGVFLHLGRSGAVALDVDHADRLPEWLAEHLAADGAPHQTSRADDHWRGHFLFLMPEGRRLGNGTGGLGSAWGQVRGANGVIVAAPSVHENAADGGRYAWRHTGELPELPARIADALVDADPAEDAVTDAEVARFREQHTRALRPGLLAPVVADFHRRTGDGESRHDSAVTAACWAARDALAEVFPAADAFDQLADAFITAMSTTTTAGARVLTERAARDEHAGIVAWAIAQAEALGRAGCIERVRTRVPGFEPDAPSPVAALVDQLRTWQHLPDPTHVVAALAVAVTAECDDGEPAWLLLVAPPSDGKTAVVDMLAEAAVGRLDEITAAGLLSWTKGGKDKPPKPTGLLSRVTHGLVTFGDLSTLLATSDRGGRDQVFALLRRVYDGRVTRDVGAPSGAGAPGPLEWEGRLTVVGAVTGAIDNFSAHSDALGPRWMFCRLPARDTAGRRATAHKARRRDLAEHKATARGLAATAVAAARDRLDDVEITDTLHAEIVDAALVTCWGRASVPRHGYGRREIDGAVVVESPPRLVHQLSTLTTGALALGYDEDGVAALVRRVALDSMPAARRAVLDALTIGADNATTAKVARVAGLDRGVVRRTLEELEAIGVVVASRDGDEPEGDDPDRRPCSWRLDGEDGALITVVFARAAGRGGVSQSVGTNPPIPPEGGPSDQNDARAVPTLRNTSERPGEAA